jgi:hypothetical protein
MAKRKHLIPGQRDLFEEDEELLALREKEIRLAEAHKEIVKLPAKLEREKRERESTMPPMGEIIERQKINEFERSLSRGQIENVLRTQRQSFFLMVLLVVTTALMLGWAFRIMFP